MATKKTLETELARLESINDQLVTEISYVDHLMRMIGFSEGLVSLKATANELYHTGGEINFDEAEDEEESIGQCYLLEIGVGRYNNLLIRLNNN